MAEVKKDSPYITQAKALLAKDEYYQIPEKDFLDGVEQRFNSLLLQAQEYKALLAMPEREDHQKRELERKEKFFQPFKNLKIDYTNNSPDKTAEIIIRFELDKAEQSLGASDKGPSYPSFINDRLYSSSNDRLQNELATIRQYAYEDIKKDKFDPKLFQNKEGYIEDVLLKYMSQERDIIQKACRSRSGNAPMLMFIRSDLEDILREATFQPGKEGQTVFDAINAEMEKRYKQTENPAFRHSKKGRLVDKLIIETLENYLVALPYKINQATIEKLKLTKCFLSHFNEVFEQKGEVSMSARQIRYVAQKAAEILKDKDRTPDPVADARAIMDEIANRATLPRDKETMNDIRKQKNNPVIKDRWRPANPGSPDRYTKNPEETVPDSFKHQHEITLGSNGTGTGIAGIGLVSFAALVSREKADKDGKPIKNSTFKTVFTTAMGVAGAFLAFDGFVNEGRHTRDLINRMRGNGGPTLN